MQKMQETIFYQQLQICLDLRGNIALLFKNTAESIFLIIY